jgi:hypothetical protein
MIYTIKKGKHRSTYVPEFTCKNAIIGTFEFVDDPKYTIDKQKDTNKMIGLSDAIHHHWNSIRIGWRWNKEMNNVEFMTILYQRGKRTIEHLCYMGSTYNVFILIIKENSYVVTVNDTTRIIPRKSRWQGPRVVLKPYFGGTTAAPKEFTIDIQKHLYG